MACLLCGWLWGSWGSPVNPSAFVASCGADHIKLINVELAALAESPVGAFLWSPNAGRWSEPNRVDESRRGIDKRGSELGRIRCEFDTRRQRLRNPWRRLCIKARFLRDVVCELTGVN
jgi:hypothetical protein